MIHMCQAVDEALQEREIRGEMKGKRNMIILLLTKKLGSLSNAVIEKLANIPAESIDRLSIAVFDIENEDDILQLIN